jgi:hypothetical protein
LYIGGEFTRLFSQSEYFYEPRTLNETNKCTNAAAVKLHDGTDELVLPRIRASWKPEFRGPVISFVSHDNSADGYVYCYGSFHSIGNESTSFLAAVSKAESPATLAEGSVLRDWNPSLETGPLNTHTGTSLIRSNTPGRLIVGGTFTKVGPTYRYRLAEISDLTPVLSPATPPLSGIAWDCGAQAISPGIPLSMDVYSTTTERVTSLPYKFEHVTAAEFILTNDEFKGIIPGQPMRFFIRRPGLSCHTNDTLQLPAYVIGCKVDFNQ